MHREAIQFGPGVEQIGEHVESDGVLNHLEQLQPVGIEEGRFFLDTLLVQDGSLEVTDETIGLRAELIKIN